MIGIVKFSKIVGLKKRNLPIKLPFSVSSRI